MARIYFDKQIFSSLFKSDKKEYEKLLEILEYKKPLICYSHALLLDLKNDKTDYKYKELNFIEKLVKDNYLSYHALDKKTSPYLAKPLKAFEDVENENNDIDFDEIFNIQDDSLSESEKKIFKILRELVYETSFNLNVDDFKTKDFPILNKLFPEMKKSMSLIDFMEYGTELVNTLNEDKALYKELRKISDDHINNGKFIIKYNDVDFNEDFKNSILKKTFIEHINHSLNPNEDREVTRYDFFTNAYINLDILGISKESRKSVRFKNLMNDGLHSYYGAYCDIVVSEDKGFLKKSKVLYKLLNIDTRVVNTTEFVNILNKEFTKDKSALDLFNRIHKFIDDENLKNYYSNIETKELTRVYLLKEYFLNYFNHLNVYKTEDINNLYFYKLRKNYSYFGMYREYELIVNSCYNLFGLDAFGRKEYDFENENLQMKNGNWQGRYWDFGILKIIVDLNKNYFNEIFLLFQLDTKETNYSDKI